MEDIRDKVLEACPIERAAADMEEVHRRIKGFSESEDPTEKQTGIRLESVSACTLVQIRFLLNQIKEL